MRGKNWSRDAWTCPFEGHCYPKKKIHRGNTTKFEVVPRYSIWQVGAYDAMWPNDVTFSLAVVWLACILANEGCYVALAGSAMGICQSLHGEMLLITSRSKEYSLITNLPCTEVWQEANGNIFYRYMLVKVRKYLVLKLYVLKLTNHRFIYLVAGMILLPSSTPLCPFTALHPFSLKTASFHDINSTLNCIHIYIFYLSSNEYDFLSYFSHAHCWQ